MIKELKDINRSLEWIALLLFCLLLCQCGSEEVRVSHFPDIAVETEASQ